MVKGLFRHFPTSVVRIFTLLEVLQQRQNHIIRRSLLVHRTDPKLPAAV
jgi:hypothetical protein